MKLYIITLLTVTNIAVIYCRVPLPSGWTSYADYCNTKVICARHLKNYPNCKHTVCERGNCGPIKGCSEHHQTDEERSYILHMHNDYRNLVANGTEKRGGNGAGATNMHVLNWDNELYFVVSCHFNRCEYYHDICRNVNRFMVGQCMAYEAGFKGNNKAFWTQEWTKMYEEIELTNVTILQSFFSSYPVAKYGHYFQLIWADTRFVGCSQHDNSTHRFAGCDYGPRGNWKGEQTYKFAEKPEDIGKDCGASGRNLIYNALCGKSLPLPGYNLFDTGKADLQNENTIKNILIIMTLCYHYFLFVQ